MNRILLVSAGVLGGLAFFEPCTIATHLLFSIRLNQQSHLQRLQNLLTVWVIRVSLYLTILFIVVWGTEPVRLEVYQASILLVILATLYVASRFVYLPIPHLKFYKFALGKPELSDSVQLGLTLPACTIPLFLIVAGLVLISNSLSYAALASLLFATMFTAPMAIISFQGLEKRGQTGWNLVAKGTPFLTAFLIYSAALILLLKK